MTDKLQELTDKLYNEGLSKGKAEGEVIVKNAEKKAEDIIDNARKEAAAIIEAAEKKAADIRQKAEADIRMASAQTLQATKKDVENLLLNSAVRNNAGKALQDPEFLKTVIQTVAGKFSEGSDIDLLLPENMKAELESWVAGELAASLGRKVSADFSKKIAGGFTIAPSEGGWFVSFTDESFKTLFAEYLRPVTRKLLFGE